MSCLKLSKSKEEYLKTVYILHIKSGYVRSVDIAKYLGVTKAGVSAAVKHLRNSGYLVVDYMGCVSLSEKGRRPAFKLYERYIFLIRFLCKIGVPKEIAVKDACLIEHYISDESYERLKVIINNIVIII